jgi:2-polyprenyl-6-methoxyphenol hydroxylase-like FAD-dependent oxidoreductase
VSRVRLPSWSDGRVALLGDAASRVSRFGDGSTSAMTGAATLAAHLATHPHPQAFAAYEHAHRRIVDPRQRMASPHRHRWSPPPGPGSRCAIFGSRVLARS